LLRIFRAAALRAALAEHVIKLVEAGNMDELKRYRHCVGGSNYHIQLTPKYRRRVFDYRHMRELVKAVIRMKLKQMGIGIGAIEFGPDHIHLFLTDCSKYDVPTIIRHIKGFSSWYLRKNYWDLVKEYLWGNAFWSGGYFFESVGRVTMKTIALYIKRQRGKHWMHEAYEAAGNAGGVSEHSQMRLERFGA
jgi:putative transposase